MDRALIRYTCSMLLTEYAVTTAIDRSVKATSTYNIIDIWDNTFFLFSFYALANDADIGALKFIKY